MLRDGDGMGRGEMKGVGGGGLLGGLTEVDKKYG